MGDQISIMCKPTLLLDSMIKEKAVKEFAEETDLNEEELMKLVDSEGLDKNIVLKILFEQHNFLNIGNIWKFPLITKLQLSNNFIEEIECLEFLVNLQFLDLSFNSIKIIKGLKDLICLKYLNLSFNEIKILQNMESLKKLEIFFVGYNKLKSFDNIHYLTQFKHLISLGIDENSLETESDVRLHILSVLPRLRMLDFKVVEEDEVKLACEQFQKRNVDFNDLTSKTSNTDESIQEHPSSFSKGHTRSDQEALVDGLANGRGLEKLLENDKNFYLLYSFPPVAKYANSHRKKITEVFDDWHQYGFNYYQQMQKEKKEFLKMIKEAHDFVLTIVQEEEYEFINFKENMPKEFCLIIQKYSSTQMDEKIIKLKEKWEAKLLNAYRNFMSASSCLLIDLIQKMSTVFKKEMLKIKAEYLNDVEAFFKKIMSYNDVCISEMMTYYSDMFDDGPNFNKEDTEEKSQSLDPALLQILQKKEYVEAVLQMASKLQSSLLQERIEKLTSSLNKLMDDTLDLVFKYEFYTRRSELTRNILIFCLKQKFIIDEFFSKSTLFEQHLKYE